jgi:hypothetical protein
MTTKYEIPYKSSINTAKYLSRMFDNALGILSQNPFQANSVKISYRIKDKNATKKKSKYVLMGDKKILLSKSHNVNYDVKGSPFQSLSLKGHKLSCKR